MKRFDCLAQETCIGGRHFLEASAGTGKTFTIEHIVARLLLLPLEGKERALFLEEICLVTFTRAATRDLKERVYCNLKTVLSHIESAKSRFDYVQAIIDKGESSQKEASLALSSALESIEKAQIFTIHGFCHRMLLTYAFEAGSSLTLPNPEGGDGMPLIMQVTLDCIRAHAGDLTSAQLAIFLSKFRSDFTRASKHVAECASSSQEIPEQPPLDEIRKACEAHDFTGIRDEFELISRLYKGVCDRAGNVHAKWLDQVNAAEESNFDAMINKEHVFDLFTPTNKKKKAGDTPCTPIISRFMETVYPLVKTASSPNFSINYFAQKTRCALLEMLEDGTLCPPDHLLHKMKCALEKEAFLHAVKGAYLGLIVDEFQDTCKVQWSIFEKITREHRNLHAFYLIGDPKQSIYSFRGADIETYLNARATFTDHALLDTNYRSTPKLVEALNTIFKPAGWLKCAQMEYYPVKAGLESSEIADDIEPLHLFAVLDKKRSFKEIEQNELFPFIASEIIRLYKLGHALSEMVILIKDRFQGARLGRYLQASHIPFVSKGVETCSESPVFSFMQLLLRALLEKNDQSLFKELMGHSFVGMTKNALLLELDDALDHMAKVRSTLTREGLPSALTLFLHKRFSNHSPFECLSIDLGLYSDFVQIWSFLIEQGMNRPLSDLLLDLDVLKKRPLSDPLSVKKASFVEDDGVHVMTTHVSKGLEFPIVFALGISTRSTGFHEISLEGFSEQMRQLYVALTRASKRAYFPVIYGERSLDSKASPAERFWQHVLGQEIHMDALQNFAKDAPISLSTFQEGPTPVLQLDTQVVLKDPPRMQMFYPDKYFTSFSAMAKPHHTTTIASDETALPRGAETGNIVHALLEKAVQEGAYQGHSLKDIVKRHVSGTKLQNWEKSVFEMAERAFNVPLDLSGESVALKDIPQEHLLTELEFVFQESNHFVKGFIDLIFRWQDTYYILDWKTNDLGGDYSKQTLEQAMKEHDYLLQSKLYEKALAGYLEGTSFELGGSFYFFLRGATLDGGGVYARYC